METSDFNSRLLAIGNVSKLLEIPAYTLRYWEKEFNGFLNPNRSEGKQRKYENGDINLLIKIKKLLKEERYSIAGARQKLQEEKTNGN